MSALLCHNCQKELDLEENQKISRREECPHCDASIYCCSMCSFYDPTAYNECKEPMANRITEKTKANFCTYFRLCSGADKTKQEQDRQDVFAAAEALFKK